MPPRRHSEAAISFRNAATHPIDPQLARRGTLGVNQHCVASFEF